MAEQDVLKLAREGIEAFNAGDWQRFKTQLASDAVYQEPATQRRVQGPDQAVQINQAWRETFPDAKGTITKAFASGDTAVLEITWEGTQRGPLNSPSGTIPATGKRISVPAVQVVTVKGDKVKETRHYFDMMSIMQQVGALPRVA
jgi:steroid delta-isomerase-like uncharacterized protein